MWGKFYYRIFSWICWTYLTWPSSNHNSHCFSFESTNLQTLCVQCIVSHLFIFLPFRFWTITGDWIKDSLPLCVKVEHISMVLCHSLETIWYSMRIILWLKFSLTKIKFKSRCINALYRMTCKINSFGLSWFQQRSTVEKSPHKKKQINCVWRKSFGVSFRA